MQTHPVIDGQNELNRRRTEAGTAVNHPQKAGDIAAGLSIKKPTQDTPQRALPEYAPKMPPVERFALSGLDTTKHKEIAVAVAMARLWAKRKRDGQSDASLILCGNNGTGKTHIARAILWSMIQCAVDDNGDMIPGTEQPSGAFYACNDLLGMLGNSRDTESGITVPARASVVIGNKPLIVIDDVGTEQVIPFVSASEQTGERHARFFKVVDYCYTAQISIIITSNLQVEELAAYVGRRSWDRLLVMAPKLPNGDSFICKLFNVPSYRQMESGR